MSKIKFFYILFSALALSSCQTGKNENTGAELSIDINQSGNLSSILDSCYTYTILESREESLIGEISKIELSEDRIYILDSRYKAVFIFDKKGKFINRIKKIGQGPGEYTSLTDMEILNSDVYVLARNRVVVYGEDGAWIKTILLDTHYSNFHLLSDKYIILYSGKTNSTMYDFTLYDYVNKSIIKRFFPYETSDGYIPYNSPFYVTDSRELLIAKEYDYNIYSFADDNLNQKYTLKFNTTHSIPQKDKNVSMIEFHDQLSRMNVVTRINCLNKSEKYIILAFPLFHDDLGIRTHFALIDYQTREIKHIRLGDIIDSAFPYFDEPSLIKNGYVVCPVEADRLIRMEKNFTSLSLFKDKISEDDNPVLFFYKLKKW